MYTENILSSLSFRVWRKNNRNSNQKAIFTTFKLWQKKKERKALLIYTSGLYQYNLEVQTVMSSRGCIGEDDMSTVSEKHE